MKLTIISGRSGSGKTTVVNALADFLFWNAVTFESVGHILCNVHVREERVRLEHHVHGPFVRGHLGDVDAIDPYLARCRRLKPCKNAEKRSLSAARCSQ